MKNEQHSKILDLLAEGKITFDQARDLFDAVDNAKPEEPQTASSSSVKVKAQWLNINVVEHGNVVVEMRIPLKLIRAGVKLGALIPPEVMKKMGENHIDFDFSNINPDNIEELIEGISEMTINVSDGGDGVRMWCD